MSERRTWSMPEQPGREVQTIEDGAGQTWDRVEHFEGADMDAWMRRGEPNAFPVEWEEILHDYGPLRDVTP